MGDYFHTIIFNLKSDADISIAIEAAQNWMIQSGIIVAEADDSALSVSGHRPGPNVDIAIANQGEDLHYWLELRTNGMGIGTGRQAFIGWALMGEFKMACNICDRSNAIPLEKMPPDFFDILGNWYGINGNTNLACPICGTKQDISEWDYGNTIGFGNLGFVFWNWPHLKEDFVKKVSQIVGQEAKVISGKI